MEELLLGIDIGSTTTKVVLLSGNEIIYQKYQRHFSKVRQSTVEILREMQKLSCKKNAKFPKAWILAVQSHLEKPMKNMKCVRFPKIALRQSMLNKALQ